MTSITILYMIAAFLAIVACIPQVLTLYRIKFSDEFQLTTWTVWLFAQMVSLAYMYSFGNVLLIVTNTLWVTFYGLMVVLIVTYRPKTLLRLRFSRAVATFSFKHNS